MTNDVPSVPSVTDANLALAAEVVSKAARFAAFGVTDAVIADAIGVSVSEVQALRQTGVFQQAHATAVSELAEIDVERDASWDDLERKALQNLKYVLGISKDPDLNLRVAAMANKATRRTRVMNQPVDAVVGTRVTLKLTRRTVERLSQPVQAQLNGNDHDATQTQTREVREVIETLETSEAVTEKELNNIIDGKPAAPKRMVQSLGDLIDER